MCPAPAPRCPRCDSNVRARRGGAGPHYACGRWPSCRGLLPADDRLLRRAQGRGIKANPEAARYFDDSPDEPAPAVPEPSSPPPAPVTPRPPAPDLPLVLAAVPQPAALPAPAPGRPTEA